MSTKALYDGQILNFYESTTGERIAPMAPFQVYEDFEGTNGLKTATNGARWAKKATGSTTQLDVADEVNGVVACTLAVTSEKEESGIYWADQRILMPGQGLFFEARVKVSITPTLLAEASWGLASDYVEDIDAVTSHATFKVDGSTAVLCESDNNVTDVDDVATGVVAGTTDWRIYRIDATDAANVKFFIDGVRVASTTTFKLLVGTTLQPYFYVYKLSGAGLGEIKIDYVRVWQRRA